MAPRAVRASILAIACVGMVLFVTNITDERQVASVRESYNLVDDAMAQIGKQLDNEAPEQAGLDVVDSAMDEIAAAMESGKVPAKPKAQAAAAAPTGKVHKNLVALKAYSVVVHDKVQNMLSHKHSAVIPFINAFGKDASNKNIILEYAKIYAETSDAYESGLGQYMLEHMNHAILNGDGVVGKLHGSSHSFTLDNDVLGLQTLPNYMKALKVSVMKYTDAVDMVTKLNANADAYAAEAYLKGKHSKAYVSFLDREIARVDALTEAHEHGYVMSAFDAEVDAYKSSYKTTPKATLQHVAVQPPAGVDAAQAASDADKWVRPTYAQIKATAKANAALFMKNLHSKLSSTADLIKTHEAQDMGVTIIMTSGQYLDGESSQTPTVVVKGSKGTISGKLSSLPLPGKKLSQTLPSKHLIGELKSVELTASSNDPWSCEKFEVKVGQLPAVPMQQTGFWLEKPTPAGAKGPVVNHQGQPFAATWTLTPA